MPTRLSANQLQNAAFELELQALWFRVLGYPVVGREYKANVNLAICTRPPATRVAAKTLSSEEDPIRIVLQFNWSTIL